MHIYHLDQWLSTANKLEASGKSKHILHILHTINCSIFDIFDINVSCEAPETVHKDWVKQQGDCSNQGPHVLYTMMMHSLLKEAAALLCEGVQGNLIHILHILHM